jgi:phage terminase small subunit
MKGTRRPLTERQARFVKEYCVSWHLGKAAAKAGYAKAHADRTGYALIEKTHIQDAIEVERAKYRAMANVSAVRILQEYVTVGLSDIGNIVKQDANGEIEVRNLDEMPVHIRACIATIEQKETGSGQNRQKTTKVTLWPKLPALDSLAKMLGFNKARLDVELAAQENSGKGKPFDPRDLPDDEWELYKKMRARMIEQRGL